MAPELASVLSLQSGSLRLQQFDLLPIPSSVNGSPGIGQFLSGGSSTGTSRGHNCCSAISFWDNRSKKYYLRPLPFACAVPQDQSYRRAAWGRPPGSLQLAPTASECPLPRCCKASSSICFTDRNADRKERVELRSVCHECLRKLSLLRSRSEFSLLRTVKCHESCHLVRRFLPGQLYQRRFW